MFCPQELVAKDKCNSECTSDAEQLCGGRSASLGERYSSVYRCTEPERSLDYADAEGVPEPQRPCRIDFWKPEYRITGTAPKSVVAGDAVFVLADGVNESITPVDSLNDGLSICGQPCTGSAQHSPAERAALLANFSTGPWADDLPLGIYDAVTLLCRMPECEAGKAQALLFVPQAK